MTKSFIFEQTRADFKELEERLNSEKPGVLRSMGNRTVSLVSTDNSIEAELLPEEHDARKIPTEASNTEVERKLINLNFEVMFKEYRSMQVEFATVDTQIW